MVSTSSIFFKYLACARKANESEEMTRGKVNNIARAHTNAQAHIGMCVDARIFRVR